MTDANTHHGLMEILVVTARAHHEETGGSDERWAEWYAEHLIDDANRLLGSEMTTEALAAWLTEADRRYHEAPPETSWPRAYATWLLEESD